MKLKITVHGVAYEVDVEVLDAQDEMLNPESPLPQTASTPPVGPSSAAMPSAAPSISQAASATPPQASGDVGNGVVSPIAGTVLEIKCKVGDQVSAGQALLVIEAMKMETEIAAPGAGKVKAVPVAPGDAVRENQMLVEFE